MNALSLITLSSEILGHICGYLPCSSALKFILVCRTTYRACNDWSVWRNILAFNTPHYYPFATVDPECRGGWKRCGVALSNASTNQNQWNDTDLEQWLPHVVACVSLTVLERDMSSLYPICDSVIRSITCASEFSFLPSSKPLKFSDKREQAWELAQAASLCLTTQTLAASNPKKSPDDPQGEPPLKLADLQYYSFPTVELGEGLSKLQTMAIRAIGLFSKQIRNRLCGGLAASRSAGRSAALPTGATIPFTEYMTIRAPFIIDDLRKMNTCHLLSMTEPTFLTESEWTGYLGTIFLNGITSIAAIGGFHWDGFPASKDENVELGGGRSLQSRRYEPVVRFKVVEHESLGQYTLQSNDFHSKAMLHNMQITVFRATGQLLIEEWQQYCLERQIVGGEITPFGIVIKSAIWMWLWNID